MLSTIRTSLCIMLDDDQRGFGSAIFEDEMLSNRSIPRATVIPVLAYPDVNQAATWLCDAFGFSVRLRIGNHRIQLHAADGAVIVREFREGESKAPLGVGCSVTIRIEDADAHCERARAHGAQVTQAPTTYPFGERQYNVVDFAGHSWTFSQSVCRCSPAGLGRHRGTAVNLLAVPYDAAVPRRAISDLNLQQPRRRFLTWTD
ncbi:MAG TPA: VOC family protein [Terriglobales bacterium]|nr:VOC family protein [Terriglobales bacterium]